VTSAVARVEQRIIFGGRDNSKAAATSAAKGLAQIEHQAVSTQAALQKVEGPDLKNIREVSGDVESALKGVADFGGEAEKSISKVGDAFGATEAIMRLIPGPIGLAATAVAGLALGSKLLFDQWSQNSAKLALLTDSGTRQLGESLGFGADETVRLQAALDGLETRARPPAVVLEQVAANAKAIGGEPAEAVSKFIAAWERGPEAVAKLRSEIGQVSAALATLPDVAQRLGLDAGALGLQAEVTAAQRLEAELRALRDLEAQRDAATAKADDAKRKAADWQAAESAVQIRQFAAIRDDARASAANLEERRQLQADYTRELGLSVQAIQQVSKVQQESGQIRAESEALAALALDKSVAADIRLQGIEEQRVLLVGQIQQLQAQTATAVSDEVREQQRVLTLQVQQLDAQRIQLQAAEAARKKQDAERAKQRAQQAADRARARADAEAQAQIRLARAEADAADGARRIELQLRLVDQQADLERRGAQRAANTAKGRAAALAAIDQEAASKRLDIERKVQDEIAKAIEASNARSAQLAADGAAADRSIRALELNGRIGVLRAAGDEEAAIELERVAARERLAAREAELDARRAEQLATVVAGSVDQQNIEKAILAEKLQAQVDYAASVEELNKKLKEVGDKETERLKAQLAEAGQLLSRAAGSATGTVGAGIRALGDTVNSVASGWKGLKESGPAAISASGAVAAAFIKDTRAQAGVQAVFETAAGFGALATGNIPGSIAHFVAAGTYGLIAGGVIKTASAGGGRAGGSVRSAANPGGSSPALGSPEAVEASARSVYININRPLSTAAEVGKEVKIAQRAAARAGFAMQRGV